MPQKRLTQIARRFVGTDEFNSLKLLVTEDEERKSAHAELAKQMKMLKEKILEFGSAGDNLGSDVNDIRRELRQKATMTRLEQVEIHLHDYATKDDFRRLRSAQESYTTIENFSKNRIAQDRINNQFEDKLSTLVSKA